MRRLLLIAWIAACAAAQLPAQLLQLRITGLDGLASKATESVDITLDSNLLQMAGGFLAGAGKDGKDGKDSKDGADIKGLLAGLKAITVRSYQFKETGQSRMEDLEPIRAQLRTPGWNKIISSQSKDETSEIYTRIEKGKVAGFAIIAAEPKELTVVAIEGSIDLNDLSKLKALGVPSIPVPDKKGKQQ
jgi:hypothetical protein